MCFCVKPLHLSNPPLAELYSNEKIYVLILFSHKLSKFQILRYYYNRVLFGGGMYQDLFGSFWPSLAYILCAYGVLAILQAALLFGFFPFRELLMMPILRLLIVGLVLIFTAEILLNG